MSDKIYNMDTISLKDIIAGRKSQDCWTCANGEQLSTGALDSVVYCKVKKEYIWKEPIQLCLFYEIKDFNQKQLIHQS